MKRTHLYSGFAVCLVLSLLFAGCAAPAATPAPTAAPASAAKPAGATAAPSASSGPSFPVQPVTQLKVEDLKAGAGAEAVDGKTVTVNYTGWLTNGTKFDSSLDRNQPFSFVLGAGRVIKGWDQGVKGMKVGGKRRLTIPPSLGYGAQANGPIPANSTLVFDVELLDVK